MSHLVVDRRDLGRRIRWLRRDRQWTQYDLAAESGVSRNTLSRWEIGARMPDVESLWRIADAFDCSLDWLVGRTP